MTGPLDRPRWRALEIGPGGVSPASVQPLGGDAPRLADNGPWGGGNNLQSRGSAPPPIGSATQPGAGARQMSGGAPSGWMPPGQQNLPPQPASELPLAWQQWTAAGAVPELPGRRALRGPVRKIAAAVSALCILVGLALWGNSARPLSGAGSGQVAVGDCLSSTGRQIDGQVSCGDGAADFLVVGRYPDTADAGECTASPADLAVVQLGPTLLCLDYVAATGDCLLLGHQAGQVGKVACASGTPGQYRVSAVLKNSISADDCPTGTIQTLVHQYNSEVVCLSRP